MGNFRGHVAPGLAFAIQGLWHMLNNTFIHARSPNRYLSLPWFPTRFHRHLELYCVMAAAATSISMELFIMPRLHHPLDPSDATIPSNHLHNFEHSNISLSFFTYAFFAILLDKLNPPAADDLTHFLGTVMLAQEFLLFNLHSTDHVGLEGQYHWLLQILILAALATTIVSIKYRRSFVIGYTRSLAVLAQGAWLIVMGYMLYTPTLIPKGCVLMKEEGHDVIKCDSGEAVNRANSLATILFSYFVVGMSVVGVVVYVMLYKLCCGKEDDIGANNGDEEMKGLLHLHSQGGTGIIKG